MISKKHICRIGILKCLFFPLTLLSAIDSKAQAPSNDDPCSAISITPATACTYQFFSNDNATATAGAPDPGCANYQSGDVWFQVTVPAGGALNFDWQVGTMNDGGMAIYSGTCNNLTLIDCDDDNSANGLMPFISAGGLTPGSTIWIRFWAYGTSASGTFGLCVTIPPPPPTNDEPCNAISLTVQPNCNYQFFTNESALGSTSVADPSCSYYQGGDVWFSVVVPASGTLLIDTKDSVMTDGGMAIYSGSCGNLTEILCDDNGSSNGAMPQIISNSLTPGSTIWIRIWSYGNTNNGSFGICVSVPPPPPSNDEPCNAITIQAGDTCSYATYTNAFATASQGPPDPGCANYLGGDVWFKVTVPCSGSMTFDMIEGQMTDAGMAIYSGTCGNLTLIECDDDDSPNGLMSQITLNNLSQGSTLWIRIWEYGNDNNGTFGLCVTVPPPPGPGTSCQTANSFCTGTTYVFPNNTNVASLGGQGVYGCLFTTPNPVWYYMQIQNPGDISITINQISNNGTPIDVDFALWGPFPSLAATCGGISANNIVDCSYSTAATEVADITGAQAGQFYMLLITNFANQAGVITFQQTGGTASTNCAVICTIGASSTAPVCSGSTFSLSATSLPGGSYSWVGPNCFQSALQNPTTVTPPATPGTYTYTVTGISNTGSTCYSSTQVTVLPGLRLGNDTTVRICNSSSLNLYGIYDTTGLTSYNWTSAGNPVPNPASVNTTGTYQFTAAGSQGCKDTALVTLAIGQVTATVSATDANCSGPGQIIISNPVGTAPYSYTISSSPGSPQSSGTFSAPQGSYTMTVRDANQCTFSAPAVVGFNNNLQLSLNVNDTSVCAGRSVTLNTSSNAATYSWSPAAGLSSSSAASPVATPTGTTRYTVTATLGSCTKTDNVLVSISPAATVDAGPTQSIYSGGNVILQATASGGSSYAWTPASGLNDATVLNPLASPSATTLYTLTVTSPSGCISTDTVSVIVIPYCIMVKNAFSPNGDGINDKWSVYDDFGCLKNVTVHVYNRYGNRVFESRNYRNDWDGTYNGKPVPDGTYYAVIEFSLITGKTSTVKSDVTIIR